MTVQQAAAAVYAEYQEWQAADGSYPFSLETAAHRLVIANPDTLRVKDLSAIVSKARTLLVNAASPKPGENLGY